MELTHLDEEGRARMVDVGGKPATERIAVARGQVSMRPETLRLVVEKALPKGDVLAVARVAGILAAKRVPDLIPLCHPILLTKVDVDFEVDEESSRIEITATAQSRGQTGVEMEALTAVSVAALTIYDMAKAVERTMRIGEIRLVRKSGGRSGDMVLRNSREGEDQIVWGSPRDPGQVRTRSRRRSRVDRRTASSGSDGGVSSPGELRSCHQDRG